MIIDNKHMEESKSTVLISDIIQYICEFLSSHDQFNMRLISKYYLQQNPHKILNCLSYIKKRHIIENYILKNILAYNNYLYIIYKLHNNINNYTLACHKTDKIWLYQNNLKISIIENNELSVMTFPLCITNDIQDFILDSKINTMYRKYEKYEKYNN